MIRSRSASNIHFVPGAAERLKRFLEELPEVEKDRVNGMLEPEYIRLDEKTCSSWIGFRRKAWEENRRGQIHGGVISSMFDLTTAWTVIALLDDMNVTTFDLQISFIRPFRGDRFCIESEVVYAGNRNIRMRGVAADMDSGETLAVCSATLARI